MAPSVEEPGRGRPALGPWFDRIGWAGVLPFVLCVVHAWTREPATAAFLFITWSAVVQCFVLGSLWGQALVADTGDDRRPALAVLAALAFAAWCALFVGQPLWSGLALLVGHLVGYAVERRFFLAAQPPGYQRLRLLLVSAVSILHGLLLLRLLV